MKKIWLLFICIFLIACTGPINFMYKIEGPTGQMVKVAPIYIEDTWDDNDRAALNEAIKKWNYALNGKILLVVEDEHYHYTKSSPQERLILIKTNARSANDSEQFLDLAWTHGRGTGIGGNRIYFVRERIKNDGLQYVALHEIGHALGAGHIEYSGLMAPVFDRDNYQCIDKVALSAIAEYQHISIEGMKWCR